MESIHGMAIEARPCVEIQTELGEGTRWDGRRDEVLWVDIVNGVLMRQRVGSGELLEDAGSYEIGMPLGVAAPVEGDDGWLLGAGRGFARLGVDGALTLLDQPAPEGTRVNDGAADAAGRFWLGTMAEDQAEGAGDLWLLGRDGSVTRALEDLTVPNGTEWSPDARTMYLVDSGPGVILAFAFDADRGSLGDRRVLVEPDAGDAVPDGMTVDADGDLWVAMNGAGEVRRYAPDGTLQDRVTVPAPQVTCCWFGGPDLRTVFISTATEGWDDEKRKANPLSGRLFRADVDATGVPAAPFRPEGSWWPR